jgi:hypothetical protein
MSLRLLLVLFERVTLKGVLWSVQFNLESFLCLVTS